MYFTLPHRCTPKHLGEDKRIFGPYKDVTYSHGDWFLALNEPLVIYGDRGDEWVKNCSGWEIKSFPTWTSCSFTFTSHFLGRPRIHLDIWELMEFFAGPFAVTSSFWRLVLCLEEKHPSANLHLPRGERVKALIWETTIPSMLWGGWIDHSHLPRFWNYVSVSQCKPCDLVLRL